MSEVGIPGRGSCAVCGASARLGQLACTRCWFRLPKPLRDDVWLAYRRFQNGDIDLITLREVQRQAIQWLREKA